MKLSLSAGCTCPNRDGTIAAGGCSFCSEGGSGDFAAPFAPVKEQIRQAKKLVDPKFPKTMPAEERKYIAYFQSFTNTYGDTGRLEKLYCETAEQPEIVILSIGTRPDCLGEEVMEMLAGLNRIKPVWVELGLQTIHQRTADSFGRGYTLPVFEEAVRKLKAAGITVIVHVILGLPGESREDMLETVKYIAAFEPRIDGIKLQLLHVLKGTRLGAQYRQDLFPVMTMEEYTDLVVDCLKLLPEDMIVHRMTGDAPKKLLIAPAWSADKKRVLNMLRAKITAARRESRPETSVLDNL